MKNTILIIGLFFFTNYFVTAQNYSLDFDGVDDLVTSPVMNDTLNTIEFWVKNDVDINGAAQLSLPFNFSSAIQYISFNNCCSGISGETITIVNNNTTPSATNQILTAGWHHIAFTSNGTNYNKVYIDGILANMISTNSPVIHNTKLDLGYRTYANPFGQFPYNGRFDEIRIWKVIKTQTEIQNNMNIELTGNEPNLVLYYKMDNINSPCDIQDCSPFGFNGIRTGVNGSNNRPQFSPDVPLLTIVACGATNNCMNVSIVSSASSICNGESVTITASGGSTYQWSGGSSSTSSTIIVSPASTTTYFLQVTNGSVIINDTITIQVTPIPVATISGNQTICSGQSTTLTANGANSYQWSGGITDTTSSISISPPATTLYTVTPNNGGCNGNPVTVAINVTPMPNTTIFSTNSSICIGQSTSLMASGGSNFQWSGGSSSTSSSISVNPIVTTTYYLQASNGSCMDYDSITIQVDSIPIASISGNQPICSGQSAILTASGANSYQWSGGITASTPIIMVSPLTTTNYVLTPINGGCKGDSITVAVTVSPMPNATIDSTDNSICVGQTVTLTASGGSTFQWSGGSSSTSSSISVNPIVTTTYYLKAANGSCMDNDSITIQVDSIPIATISGNQTICSGQSTTLTANGANSYQWSGGITASTQVIMVSPLTTTNYVVSPINGGCKGDSITVAVNVTQMPTPNAGIDQTIFDGNTAILNGNGGGSYSWNPSSDLNCTNCQNPVASPLQTTTYYLTVSSNGCSAIDSVTIFVDIACGEIFVPSAFSPNGDNENNFECVYGKCIQTISFAIFDRWGEKVFESTNQNQCWDGTYKGKKLDTGVFAYYLKASLNSGKEVIKKGNISLIK